MHPLLRYTLDLFESNQPIAQVDSAQPAIKKIAIGVHQPGEALDKLVAPATFRHPRANREARLSNAVVAYEFKRGKRRTIGFSVGPDGLVVRAPSWATLHEVDAALQKKSLWIIRKLGETRERHQRLVSNRIEWRDGASFPFLGEPVQLVLEPRQVFGAGGAQLRSEEGGLTLQIGLSHAATPEQIRDAVQAWLMRQAKRIFTERLDHFAPQLQVNWRKLSLSNAGTRWGSARIDGSIRLNWRLVHFRQPVIDYVVAHELSHLRVMDHSARFWDTVQSVVPDYAVLRGQLKDDSVPRWT
jgi:predicted metal-dependent hydrolase